MATKDGERVGLLSRTGRDWADTFPGLIDAVRALPVRSAVLDGEVARFDEQLVSRFDLLPNEPAGRAATPPLYAAFDLIRLDGRELAGEALAMRRRELKRLLEGRAPLLFPARRFAGDGRAAFAEARRRGYEGIAAKREARGTHRVSAPRIG